MKVTIKHTLIYLQEEDSENWDDPIPKTPEELLQRVKDYVKTDMSYILDSDCDANLVSSEIVDSRTL